MFGSHTFSGKLVVVTGGGGVQGQMAGFGQITCELFAKSGASVAVIDINHQRAQHTVDLIRQSGGKAEGYVADVSQVAACDEVITQIVAKQGNIHVLVNNAGICRETPFDEITESEWDLIDGINGKGSFFIAQAAFKNMKVHKEGGTIVWISSDAGRKGAQVASGAYTYSKAGVLGLMRSAARSGTAHGIRSVAVCPGPGETEMTKAWPDAKREGLVAQMLTKKLVQPEEIALASMFAAHPSMGSMTGNVIDVNGGLWIG